MEIVLYQFSGNPELRSIWGEQVFDRKSGVSLQYKELFHQFVKWYDGNGCAVGTDLFFWIDWYFKCEVMQHFWKQFCMKSWSDWEQIRAANGINDLCCPVSWTFWQVIKGFLHLLYDIICSSKILKSYLPKLYEQFYILDRFIEIVQTIEWHYSARPYKES